MPIVAGKIEFIELGRFRAQLGGDIGDWRAKWDLARAIWVAGEGSVGVFLLPFA